MPWKGVLSENADWKVQRIALSDALERCPKKVQGMIKMHAKWIPMGHEESKFDENGKRREPVQIKKKDPRQ